MLSAAHSPVMTAEVVKALGPSEGSILVDATFGRGGHTRALFKHLGPKGRIYAMDRDPEACAIARDWAEGETRLTVIQAPFSKLSDELIRAGIAGQVSGIVLDLGVSSPQLDNAERGFSFMRDGPLDMRMDPSQGIPVQDWLAGVSEEDLIGVLRRLGEERYARRIARAIVNARNETPLTTTGELSSLVHACVPTREPGKHPATRTFQALRLFINQELTELDAVLPQALDMLEPGGRLVIISFHSLEDRRVKRFFQEAAKCDPFPPDLPIRAKEISPVILRPSRPQRPSEGEISDNPRARSAILRWAQKSPSRQI